MSVACNGEPSDAGITPATGVYDSFAYALVKNVNGPKNELIHPHSWTDMAEIKIVTFQWVSW